MKLTWKQIYALRYAAGEQTKCVPSYSVATRLQKKGLLVWRGLPL